MKRTYRVVTLLALMLPLLVMLAYPICEAWGNSGRTNGSDSPLENYFNYISYYDENNEAVTLMTGSPTDDMPFNFVTKVFNGNFGTVGEYVIEKGSLANDFLLSLASVNYFGFSPVYMTFASAYIVYIIMYTIITLIVSLILFPLKLVNGVIEK